MRPTIPNRLIPSPVAVLAVLESVCFGLAARHAYEGRQTAVYMTLTFVLMPGVLGFRTVASGRDRLGILPLSGFLLMLLAAWVAWGGIGPVAVLILSPLFMMMALLGGALATLLRAAMHGLAWLGRAAATVRAGGRARGAGAPPRVAGGSGGRPRRSAPRGRVAADPRPHAVLMRRRASIPILPGAFPCT